MENAVGGGKTFVYAALIEESAVSENSLITSPGMYFFRVMSRSDASKINATGAQHLAEEAQKSYQCTMGGKSVTCVFTSNQYGAVWMRLSGINSVDSITLPIELTFTVDGMMFYLVIGTDSNLPSNFSPLALDSEKYLIPTIIETSSTFNNNTSSPFIVLL